MTDISIKGASGTEYKLTIFNIDEKFQQQGGIYVFTKRDLKGNEYTHSLVYCGKTNDFSSRFYDHHKQPCISKNAANRICVLIENSELQRTKIEEDILKGNNFPCNEKLNQIG